MIAEHSAKQLALNELWCQEHGIVDMRLKEKYRNKPAAKFGGCKRQAEHSGGVGRRARARKRHPIPKIPAGK